MSSSSESSSPPPLPAQLSSHNKGDRAKQSTAQKGARNEGTTTAYQPPMGTIAVSECVQDLLFDWDTINADPNLELWMIRIPQGLKPKHLDGQTFSPPQSSKSGTLGTVNVRNSTFNVQLIPADTSQGPHDASIDAAEMAQLNVMLPRKRKGKGTNVFLAPRPVERHIVFCSQGLSIAPSTIALESSASVNSRRRRAVNSGALKHQFMPIGSEVGNESSRDDDMGGIAFLAEDEGTGVRDVTMEEAEQPKEGGGDSKKKKKRKKSLEMDKGTTENKSKKVKHKPQA